MKLKDDGRYLLNEGDDHEVSMAINSLDSIIKNASELKEKIGNVERNLPGWIQDHITNSENYIEQANSGYHELNEGKGAELIKSIVRSELRKIKDGNRKGNKKQLYLDYREDDGKLNEIGDGSAKSYKFKRFNPSIKMGDSRVVTFVTDSGINYIVTLRNVMKYLEIDFKLGDVDGQEQYALTNRGELFKIMATISKIVVPVIKKSDILGLRYNPASEGKNDKGMGRDRLYKAFIKTMTKNIGLNYEVVPQIGGTVFVRFIQ